MKIYILNELTGHGEGFVYGYFSSAEKAIEFAESLETIERYTFIIVEHKLDQTNSKGLSEYEGKIIYSNKNKKMVAL